MTFSRTVAALFCAILAACQPAHDPSPERQPPFIDIGDGSKITARTALLSASELSADCDTTIFFTHEEFGPESIAVYPQARSNLIFFCPTAAQLSEKGIFFGDELMARDERREKFNSYALGGRMSGSKPLIIVDAETGVPGTKLVEIFHELLESKIEMILTPSQRVPE